MALRKECFALCPSHAVVVDQRPSALRNALGACCFDGLKVLSSGTLEMPDHLGGIPAQMSSFLITKTTLISRHPVSAERPVNYEV